MNNPLFLSELSLAEEEKYLKFNLSLQKAMLLLVEHCHQSDYQATLDCSLKALDDDLNRRQVGEQQQAVALMTASMKKILTMVLSACFDTSKEETITKMRARFAVMDAQLSSEHEEHLQA